MYKNTFVFLITVLIFLLSTACAHKKTQIVLKNTPTEESEFHLAPEELLGKYPDVEGLHPENYLKYQIALSGTSSPDLNERADKSTLVNALGEPDRIELHKRSIVDFLSSPPMFGLLFLSPLLIEPIVTGGVLAGLGIQYFVQPREEDLYWTKGDYLIEAHTISGRYRKEAKWEWFYKINDSENLSSPIVSRSNSASYGGLSLSNFSRFGDQLYNRKTYISILYGKSFQAPYLFDNINLDAAASIQSTTKEKYYLLDITNQAIFLSGSYNINNNKQELGIGITYETSLPDVFIDGYLGRVGAYAEFNLRKQRETQTVIRIGAVRSIDPFENKASYFRISWIQKFQNRRLH
ncbi:MAG: hypothetical protein OEZ43_11555 [Gammaproteobacteria bacterium]|nr:hypothetical protein [Gammaproteobacteria bacterium]